LSTRTADLFARFTDSLPLPGRELTSADVESGQQARRELLARGAGAIPALVDALASDDFTTKDAAYDLIIEIGEVARASLAQEIGRHGPVVDIWIDVLLDHLGDHDALGRLRPLLRNPDRYARHLAALAMAFHDSTVADLVPVLLEALDDDDTIEGTPFTVAGSALAMLSRRAGTSLAPDGAHIHIYNYDHFAFPPPVHPFPFAADMLTHTDPDTRRAAVERVRAWWRSKSA
jgi:HEAT repeat protein